MAQFQIIGPDGYPVLTKDDKTALSGNAFIAGTHSLLFDDGGWADGGEEGYSTDAVIEFCAKLGAGFTFNCMGRSPTARNPADIEAERVEAERRQQEADEAAQAEAIQRQRAEADIADRLLKLRDPAAYEKMMAEHAVQQRYAAEIAQAQQMGLAPDLIDSLRELMGAELAAIEAKFNPPAAAGSPDVAAP